MGKPYLEGREIKYSKNEKLFKESELQYKTRGDKKFWWNTMWVEIKDQRDKKVGVYQGQWFKVKKDMFEGLGSIEYNDGSVYRGETFGGKHNGRGFIKYKNGDLYYGDWIKGQA